MVTGDPLGGAQPRSWYFWITAPASWSPGTCFQPLDAGGQPWTPWGRRTFSSFVVEPLPLRWVPRHRGSASWEVVSRSRAPRFIAVNRWMSPGRKRWKSYGVGAGVHGGPHPILPSAARHGGRGGGSSGRRWGRPLPSPRSSSGGRAGLRSPPSGSLWVSWSRRPSSSSTHQGDPLLRGPGRWGKFREAEEPGLTSRVTLFGGKRDSQKAIPGGEGGGAAIRELGKTPGSRWSTSWGGRNVTSTCW